MLLLHVYDWLACEVGCALCIARYAAGCGPSKAEMAGGGAVESAARRDAAVLAGEDRGLWLGVRDAIAKAQCNGVRREIPPGVQDFRQLDNETYKPRN